MGEIRRDPLSGKWVIFATGEGFTSRDFLLRREGRVEAEPCPLCEGQEGRTPPEIFALREAGAAADTPGWTVRVIPDRLPLLEPGATGPVDTTPTHELRPALGHHEIVVLMPQHDRSLADMSAPEAAQVIKVLRDRYRELLGLDSVEHVVLMVNRGREAGASLRHAHAQIFALPFVPNDLMDELDLGERHLKETGACILCRELRGEIEEGLRVVVRRGDFAAFVPFAARLPFELVMAPISHSARFEDVEDSAVDELAAVLTTTFRALGEALDDPPYSLVLHSSPPGEASDLSYHWHIEVLPRLTVAANFELASDVWVNSVAPEVAASILREQVPEGPEGNTHDVPR